MTVTAYINVETPAGRKIVSDLEKHRKLVKIEYPEVAAIENEKTYTVDEVFDECIDILSSHYKVDGRKIWNSIK
ncbi:MAG: hypothetical protein Q7U47_04475 [Paludibacter sp.]|nr:hypothetical protein [Paludibacter sp.]